jgi:hypothetical protein
MPDSEVGEQSTVSYTVKELLDGHTTILRSIDSKLDGKADKADVLEVENRLAQHVAADQIRLSALEDHRLAVEAARHFRNRAWAIVASIAGILAVVGGSLIAALVH